VSNDLKSIPLWVLFFFVKNWARLTGVIFLLLDSVHENLCQYKCRQAVFETGRRPESDRKGIHMIWQGAEIVEPKAESDFAFFGLLDG
jgi:hypothetical protein